MELYFWIILDAAALLLLAVFVCWGWRRGFVATTLMLVGTLAAFWAAQTFHQPAARWAYQTFAQDRMVAYARQRLDELGAEEGMDRLAGALEEFSYRSEGLVLLDGMKDRAAGLSELLPRQFSPDLPEGDPPPEDRPTVYNSREDLLEEVAALLEGGLDPARAVEQALLLPLMMMLLEMIFFLAIFLALRLALRLLVHASGLVNRLPLLGGANRLLGACVGLAEGYVVVYITGVALRLVAATAPAGSYLTMDTLLQTRLLSAIIF